LKTVIKLAEISIFSLLPLLKVVKIITKAFIIVLSLGFFVVVVSTLNCREVVY